MEISKKHTWLSRHPFFILFIFLLLAYLPVFLPFFHLKNDLITQNLPTRYFISESLYSHAFPWWNPYLNYGIPQYGDMNNGYWNPFLWLIAKFFGYNILTITLEEMFYVLIGGWGIYKLTGYLHIQRHYSILCSLAYMSGGFMVGHLQHFIWITGTAFFPYVLLAFIRCTRHPSIRNFICGGLFSFLFISSTHPGLIIGSLYFFLFLIAHMVVIALKKRDVKQFKTIIKSSTLFGFVSAAFSLVVIISNVEVSQHMTRGSKVSLEQTLLHPTTVQSYLSLLFPVAIHKGNFFNTDVSMRNMSIGLALLPGIYFCFREVNFKKNWVLITLFFFFVFLGAAGYFKLFAYHFLPYLGYVRLNGEFAYFTYLMLIVASAYGLQQLSLRAIQQQQNSYRLLQHFFSVCFLIALVVILAGRESIFFSGIQHSSLRVKSIIDRLTFWDLVLVNSFFQLMFASILKKHHSTTVSFAVVSAFNLVLITWLCLPFTGLGQMPRKEIQAILNTVPRGIPIPSQKAIQHNKYISVEYDRIIGSSSFYSKEIGFPKMAPYPVVLKSTNLYFGTDSLVEFINKQPFLFLVTDTTIRASTMYGSDIIDVTSFTPTNTNATVQNQGFKYLIFLQNNYPRWSVFVNNKSVKHFTAFKTFVGIALPEGNHKVEFRIDARSLQIVLCVNLSILCFGLFILSQKKIADRTLLP